MQKGSHFGMDNSPVILCEKTVALDFRVLVLSCMKRWRYHGRLFALEVYPHYYNYVVWPRYYWMDCG